MASLDNTEIGTVTYKSSLTGMFWVGLLIPCLLLISLFYDGIVFMISKWSGNETYSHGFFVPLITLYLIWERRERLQGMLRHGSWSGTAVVIAGLGLFFIGEFATLYILTQLALLVVIFGLVVSAIGDRGAREIRFPLFYLFAMIPLPNFLYRGLSAWLQLVSSKLGVGCLQIVGVTAFRDGNVIDLGPIQLQVVEACDGLRYLFPMAALSLILAYLFNDRMWKRVFLFFSSLPISVFMNGFRIGMTGLLVDLYGQGLAEGFFHSFSGWILFMSSLVILLGEMFILGRIGRGGRWRSIGELFNRDWRGECVSVHEKRGEGRDSSRQFASPAYLLSIALLVPALGFSTQLASREEVPPPHQSFLSFPLQIDEWKGRPMTMEQEFIDFLHFDDYLLIDYRLPEGSQINLYAAYYRSQKKGESMHSPKTCIPGGGWEITSIEEREITGGGPEVMPLKANRVVIQKGSARQMVLYWFAGRGRILTNEYLVKFYLFLDAITMNRSDGALVRLVTPLLPDETETVAEARLIQFAGKIDPILKEYIPD